MSSYEWPSSLTGWQTEAISVEVVIIYMSGGGPESAYVINDRVSFKILKDRFADIVFEREMMSESEEDVKMSRVTTIPH